MPNAPEGPALGVVVLGYQNAHTIVAAVRSVLSQGSREAIEVVVVTSGGDDSAARVRAEFPDVPVHESAKRLMPGGARNLGVALTSAPFVAFLAADCEARPGWIGARLRAHRRGYRAVASAMTVAGPRRAALLAHLFLLYCSRLPGRGEGVVAWPDPAAHGLSFERKLLDELGPFDEEVRVGEDTKVAERLAQMGVEVWFEPEVQTAHRGPTTFGALMSDEYRRGGLIAGTTVSSTYLRHPLRDVRRQARRVVAVIPIAAFRQVWSFAPTERAALLGCWPWMVAGAIARRFGRSRSAQSSVGVERATAFEPPWPAGSPALAVVVLSYRNEDTILAAVDSILAQDEPAELVVSHSGGGDTPNLLRRERPTVRVVATEERRLPGGARNAGIRVTSAPYVAFLAADCCAEQGWVASRLRRHRAAPMAVVGSSIAPMVWTPASVASYLLRHSKRMAHIRNPQRGPTSAWPSGLSYPRVALESVGLFNEGMLGGEDSVLNHHLQQAGFRFVWAPEVLTLHAYPSTMAALLREEFRRGRVQGSSAPASPGKRIQLVLIALLRFTVDAQRALRPGSSTTHGMLLRALPAAMVAGVAASAGILRAGEPAAGVSRQVWTRLERDAALRRRTRCAVSACSGGDAERR